jgi:hypothetical protein
LADGGQGPCKVGHVAHVHVWHLHTACVCVQVCVCVRCVCDICVYGGCGCGRDKKMPHVCVWPLVRARVQI